MARLTVNQAAEVSTSFEAVRPGTYRMRIKDVVDRNNLTPSKNDLKVTLEYVDPTSLVGITGEALKGSAGNLFDYVMLDFEKQWKLRQVVEACGLPWGDLDPGTDLKGQECDVIVKTEAYEGEMRNKVNRYVVAKK